MERGEEGDGEDLMWDEKSGGLGVLKSSSALRTL
jgi:hypothetical protein